MPMPDPSGSFELSGVSFSVGPTRLLGPIDLRLAAGRITGIIGHNGSGKSTLAKLLGRQQPPSAGAIRYAGRDLAAWSTRAFARKVAYMAQDNPATGGMLVHELVALGRYPWLGPLGRAGPSDAAAIRDAMRAAGVEGFADHAVDALSGGERQRVFLALMLAQEAEFLVLDEPLSALDLSHQVGVLRLVSGLVRERGLGVAIVLHDVNLAARFCDEILALHTGREIARGTPDEIMRADILQGIYGTEIGVFRDPASDRAVAFAR